MRLIVVGAGEVGSNIAESLAGAHDVVVVDLDGDRVERLTYDLDVLAIEGDGRSLDTLREAGVEDADMLVASTDDDETNIVTCSTAKAVSDVFTIARVKRAEFLDTWRHAEGVFGVDFMVCSDLLTAETIVRIIGLPAAVDVDPFAKGRVRMAELEIGADSPVAGETVSEADRFDSLTFVAIVRNGDVTVPGGEDVIGAGDRVVVIGSPESVRAFAGSVSPATDGPVEDVVVVGGSEVGYQTARLLGEQGFSPRLIEADAERARTLAERLPGTTVMESDPTDIEFLRRENVGGADVAVACLDSDERNLLVSLLAARLGTERTVAVVDDGEYVDLFEEVGVDVAVNPREVTAEEITRFTHQQRAENVALIESDRAEVIEIEVDADSVLTGRTIADAAADLPEGVVVGAITRGESLITPRGNTVVEVGDHVVVFVDADVVDEVTAEL